MPLTQVSRWLVFSLYVLFAGMSGLAWAQDERGQVQFLAGAEAGGTYGIALAVAVDPQVQIVGEVTRMTDLSGAIDTRVKHFKIFDEDPSPLSEATAPSLFVLAGVRMPFMFSDVAGIYGEAHGGAARIDGRTSFSGEVVRQVRRWKPVASFGGGIVFRLAHRVVLAGGYRFTGVRLQSEVSFLPIGSREALWLGIHGLRASVGMAF